MKYPISSSRNASVMNGIESRSAARSTAGESASRKGFAMSSLVVSVSSDDAVCISLGRSRSFLAVNKERTKGTKENKRRLRSFSVQKWVP